MKRAVTLVAVVLGCLLGIAQAGAWSCWMCDVFGAYWARRRCFAQLATANQIRRLTVDGLHEDQLTKSVVRRVLFEADHRNPLTLLLRAAGRLLAPRE